MLLAEISSVTPCFTPGTLIATERGQRPVETLRRGDRLVTRDNGLRRIYWTGRRDVAYEELCKVEELRPVLIRAGALGAGRPARDTMVSPGHRMLVRGTSALFAGEGEVLVAARRLIDHKRVFAPAALGVSYVHLLCDCHQVILANGLWTESFHPDDQLMRAIGNTQRLELLGLFPEIATVGALRRFPPARRIIDIHSRFDG